MEIFHKIVLSVNFFFITYSSCFINRIIFFAKKGSKNPTAVLLFKVIFHSHNIIF